MTLLDRVKGLFGVTFGGPGAATYQSARDWALGIETTTNSSLTIPYAQHPSVCIAIRIIAEDAASVAWELYPGSGEPEEDQIEDHPLLDKWSKPNETMSGTDLWVGSYTFFKLTGECIWYYPGLRIGTTNGLRANRRSTGEIALLDPASVTVTPTPQGLEYKQRVNGVDVPLDADYLTHFRRFNPYNPHRGLSELASLMLELNVDWNAATWNQSFFGDQNGIPTGLLKPVVGAIVPSADREEYLKQWNTRHSRKRGVGILPPGWDWVAAGGSPKDMEFANMREFSREQILAVYGVPPFMAGVLDKANYANAREQRALYWNGTITRLLSYFQGVINHDFLPKVGVTGIEVWPDFESVKALTEDLETKSRIAQAFFAMGFTKRMLNDRLDLGMDVDELEDADVGYLPLSVLPVEMVEEAHTPAGPALPPGDDDQAQGQKPTKGFLRAAPRAMAGRRANVWRSIATQTRDLEAKVERAIRKHFRAIEQEVMAHLNSLKGWNLVHGVEKADESYLFDLQFAKGALVKLMAPLYSEAIKRGGTSVLSELDAEAAMDMLNPGVTSKLAELTQKIKRIDDTVERRLRESLVEGLRGGESISQLQTRIQSVMSASRSRAATIARTETGTAFNSGRVEGMRQAGVSKQEWLATKDSVTRDTHEALDGEVRAIDEAFSNGLRYPGDPSGLPEEIINCRCTVLPVIGEAS